MAAQSPPSAPGRQVRLPQIARGIDSVNETSQTIIMQLIARLFGEAWEHRRQRHRTLVLAGGLAAAAVAAGLSAAHFGAPKTAVYKFEPASSALRSHDLLIVTEGSDRVTRSQYAIGVTLKRPATSVTATVNGVAVTLEPFPLQIVHRAAVTFAGRRGPVAGVSIGGPTGRPATLTAELQITFGDGTRVITSFRKRFPHGI